MHGEFYCAERMLHNLLPAFVKRHILPCPFIRFLINFAVLAVGHRYTYDSFGKVLIYTDTDNNNTTNTYDSKNNILKSVTDEKATRNVYNSNGQLIQRIYPSEYNSSYDGLNDATPTDTYRDNTVGEHYTYNTKGVVLTLTSSKGISSSYEYDEKNRVMKYVNGNNITRYIYNEKGKLIQQINPNQYDPSCDGLNNATPEDTYSDNSVGDRYTYDLNGNVLSYTDPAGYITYYTYDINNKIIKSACNNNVTRYIYDVNDRLIQTIYPSQYNPAYDGLNATIPENTYSDNTVGDRYTYDAYGNILTYADSRNKVTTNTYDSDNRLIKSVCDNNVTRYLYDSKSRLVQQINPEQYDAACDGLPLQNTYSNANVGDRYIYDATGNLLSHTDSNNNTTAYTYNADGSLVTITKPDQTVYTNDLVTGRVQTEQYPSGVTNTIEFNDDGTVKDSNIVNDSNSQYGIQTRYEYDGYGRISQYSTTSGSNAKNYSYTYDTNSRLRKSKKRANKPLY